MKSVLSFLALAALLPAPALARTWTAPEGCEIFMTVQAKGCRVSNHYRCAADPEGDQWRADFDQEGLFFRSRINRETEWVESLETNPPVRQTLDADRPDPASFSELIETGIDTFEFSLSRDNGVDTLVKGFDRLTGRTVTIGGVLLEETEYEATETDGSGTAIRAGRGNEYISREMRLFFAGPGQTDLGDGQWLPIDGSPLDFIFPGEPGFASTRPLFDCDPLMTRAPVDPAADPARERLWRARYGD
ncbi:hypothetical protein [Pseudogemmobacter humi]|uniref:Uncharacterized protein n=1 Tax=Pseudogemmobacter humi TaxID=2483812 RepID=A0A3P5WY40_9RHOB|nr:hypothetical protein [Pseudogemmobacter humi]VDC20429.1 hypothetical protein XINFAN_00493 [Pseudogemmobacter humi]